MGEPRSNPNREGHKHGQPQPPSPPPPPRPPTTTASTTTPSNKKKPKPTKVFRLVRSVFRSFPVMAPLCKLPALPGGLPDSRRHTSTTKVTGTLYGPRKGRVSLSVQESPRCMEPLLIVELPIQTNLLQKEMGSGLVRIALECEKRVEKEKTKIFDEPVWTMYCNGKKSGYSVKREASEDDLGVMELLRMVSMGAGVLPGRSEAEGQDAELAYIRAYFERVVGSRDSETLYMLSPDGNNGPELSIFFVRL
ncbi:hypothetical protein H6P81_011156 [Aristolochia fimbriata]|uniref:Protein MIZU-KUSSEI 1 n=1 Tax=Aristolochia fimbriata TaxID=158543 RepID=A0AAV7ERV2_ARIFI|nr:hypothetical protein H6P81_011156 [Aristolochia fimbriata]